MLDSRTYVCCEIEGECRYILLINDGSILANSLEERSNKEESTNI